MIKKVSFFVCLLSAICALSFEAEAQKTRSIGEIQGNGNNSPLDGQMARIEGIVTARTRTGFFIQTPDDKTDGDPSTSEGIFVFTKSEPGAEASVGNLIKVSGTVTEFKPKQEPASLPITELSMYKGKDTIEVLSKTNPLPKPIVLTIDDFKSNQIDQLEKYEGMRVQIDALTAVAPTKGRVDNVNGSAVSDGVFYGVLKGTARPFREPGMDVYDFVFAKDKDALKKNYPKLPIFDANPETVRIDSNEVLGGQAIDVTSLAEVRNIVGVMHYGYQKYTILPDAGNNPAISGLQKALPLPPPNAQQFSVAGMNLENFFDDEDDPSMKEEIVPTEVFQKRLNKISLAVSDYMQMPDIIGTIEVENLSALKRLAAKINSDAVAAKKPDPKYEAFLIDGNDGRGIDVGFLVKTSRVKINEINQFGKDVKFKNPNSKDEDTLNDRPPLMLRAAIDNPQTGKPLELTVIVNHLKSFLGIDDPKDSGARVRSKRQAQAEFLAKYVQERQKADPTENIVLLGDFNAFQFNDGIGDIIGTIKGTPAPKDAVLYYSEDLVNPDLIDLVDLIKTEQRYSYTYDGYAQVLDHIIINQVLKKHLAGFGYARLNADFPEVYRNDANRVERYSDHDAAIAYFKFEDK